jgi:hypothetical protein
MAEAGSANKDYDIEVGPIVMPRSAAINTIQAMLACLNDEGRAEALEGYCRHCLREIGTARCWCTCDPE